MIVQDFVDYLSNHPNEFEYEEKECESKNGFLVGNKQYKTLTHFTTEAINKYNMEFLLGQTIHGKNVDHITRVTGYFSKVSGWNKGKLSELRDRDRVQVEG